MRRAAITGLGVVCGTGDGVVRFFSCLRAGESVLRPVPALNVRGLNIGPMALATADEARDDEALFSGIDRTTPMALRAAAEALADAGGPQVPAERMGVTFGTTLGAKAPWLRAVRGQPAWSDPGDWSCAGPARAVAGRVGAGVVRVVSTACASGNAALGSALDLIRGGRCDLVLCGGADTLNEFVIAGFGVLRAHAPEPCRPFDRQRRGMNLGEGAGFIVLEAEEHARARGRTARAYLDGYGLSADANHMTGPDREGQGAARAMAAALNDAGAATGEVDFVSLHGTATLFNDLMETRGLHALLGRRAAEVPVNSIKGAIGHTLGAAGLLEAIMAVRAMEEGYIPPTAGHNERDPEIDLNVVAGEALAQRPGAVLSTTSGFGGLNAAVLLRRGA